MNKVAFIGLGKIGRKRAEFLQKYDSIKFKIIESDPAIPGCASVESIEKDSSIKNVFIATPHAYLLPLAEQMVLAKKNVFIEKPGAIPTRNQIERLENLSRLSDQMGLRVGVGYNHRFHPAIREMALDIQSGGFGKLLHVRMKYGHGARLGYESEWRSDPLLSGGGQAIDQGTHLIDLLFYLFPNLEWKLEHGQMARHFWNRPCEDFAHFIFGSKDHALATLTTSCTEWKNIFEIEVALERAKLEMKGLYGSYGMARYTRFEMLPEMGPPMERRVEYSLKDETFNHETLEFLGLREMGSGNSTLATLSEALRVLRILHAFPERFSRDELGMGADQMPKHEHHGL